MPKVMFENPRFSGNFMSAPFLLSKSGSFSKDDGTDLDLFENIARDLETQGYSIRPGAIPLPLATDLQTYVHQLNHGKFIDAGIGRGEDFLKSVFIRKDEICWINGESEVGKRWLFWTSALQDYLNKRLFLGLFSFESHFAHYGPGDFYKKHYDAFKGETNRVLSLVTYLNSAWKTEDGGELILYHNEINPEGVKVTPLLGTLVVFLSEEFPHEVLTATRDRYSIAGWFRVNTSVTSKIDPPQ